MNFSCSVGKFHNGGLSNSGRHSRVNNVLNLLQEGITHLTKSIRINFTQDMDTLRRYWTTSSRNLQPSKNNSRRRSLNPPESQQRAIVPVLLKIKSTWRLLANGIFKNCVTFKLSAVACKLAIITAQPRRGSTTLINRKYHKIMLSLSLALPHANGRDADLTLARLSLIHVTVDHVEKLSAHFRQFSNRINLNLVTLFLYMDISYSVVIHCIFLYGSVSHTASQHMAYTHSATLHRFSFTPALSPMQPR